MRVAHLVLLPGLDGTGRLFEPLLQSLPTDYIASVVSYPPNECLSYHELEVEVRKALPTDRAFVIIAESFSGPLAVMIAATPPPQLQAVVLSTSFISNPVPSLLRFSRFFISPLWFRIHSPRSLLKQFLIGRDCPEHLIDCAIEAIHSVQPEVLADRVRQVMKVDVRQSLSSCCVPILYLRGKRDRLVGRRNWQQIAQLKADVKCVEIDAPHLLLQRRPAEALRAITEFLKEK
jgi:pimeloyl-[acyl-carrier protein] methyl ester esterase